MLPDGLLKTFLDHLFRLVRGPWRRGQRSGFRPRLELLEGRAAPSGLAIAEAPAPPPAPAALVRVSEQAGSEADPRPLPVLAGRAFEDRLFGDETGDSVRGGKDLDVLFAGRLDFPPLPGLDGADAWCSGKDDVALIFASAESAGAAVTDVVFLDSSGW